MLLAEKKMEEIEGKMKGWEHFQERATLNAILWDVFEGRNYSRGMWDVRNPSKKAGSIHKPSPETGQNMTKHVTTKRFLPCLTPPAQGHRNREFFGKTWKEHGRNRVNNEKVGNNSRRELGIMTFWGISPRMIFKVVWCSLGIGCSVGWRLHGEKNDASVPARYRHVQNEWCQTPSCSAMFSLDTLSIYLEYFPAWGSHVARIFLEAKLLKIIPYVGNVSEYFSRTTFDCGGIF